MKSINNPYEFYNKHSIDQLVLKENGISKINYEISSLILPNLKQIAKRLSFYEYVYLNDQNFFNYLQSKKFFNFGGEYTNNKISHFFFPKKNRKLIIHKSKFKIKMLMHTFNNYFQDYESVDINSKKLCFYKPNALSLKSSNFSNFESLKIKNFNNFEDELQKNDFEIFSDLKKIISNLLKDYLKSDRFQHILDNCINDFIKQISFLYNFLDKNLIFPNSEKIIVGSESRILSKLIRYKLINKNYKIYSFEHGARSLLFKNDIVVLKEHRLKFVTKYFLTGKGQYNISKKYKNIEEKIEVSKNIEPKIQNILNRKFKNSNNKKILFIMSNTDFNILFARQPAGLFYYYHKRLCNNLKKFFKENNYYYKVKNHPDTINQFIDLKDSINGSLLDLFNDFDILLFDHSTSTAFCEAINTNKKIILLDFKQNYFEDDFNKIIQKRCLIVNVDIGFSGETKLDENYFKECIESNSKTLADNYMDTRGFFS